MGLWSHKLLSNSSIIKNNDTCHPTPWNVITVLFSLKIGFLEFSFYIKRMKHNKKAWNDQNLSQFMSNNPRSIQLWDLSKKRDFSLTQKKREEKSEKTGLVVDSHFFAEPKLILTKGNNFSMLLLLHIFIHSIEWPPFLISISFLSFGFLVVFLFLFYLLSLIIFLLYYIFVFFLFSRF